MISLLSRHFWDDMAVHGRFLCHGVSETMTERPKTSEFGNGSLPVYIFYILTSSVSGVQLSSLGCAIALYPPHRLSAGVPTCWALHYDVDRLLIIIIRITDFVRKQIQNPIEHLQKFRFQPQVRARKHLLISEFSNPMSSVPQLCPSFRPLSRHAHLHKPHNINPINPSQIPSSRPSRPHKCPPQ